MINWSYVFLGNSIYQWFLGLAAGIIVLLVLGVIKWLVSKRIKIPARLPQWNASVLISRLLDRTPWIIILWLAVFASLRFLNLTQSALNVVETITVIGLLILVGLWSVEVIQFWVTHRRISGRGQLEDQSGPMRAVVVLSKIIVWTVVVILVLENIPGIHITTLIASLGIGGIAIGLALQKILGDLFASLTISIDQPFVEGDAINVDQFSGEVEHIGLKSTRVRSSTGEQLIFSNSDLLESRIRNYKRMQHRLVTFTLNVTYDTRYETLQKIPQLIQDIIKTQPNVIFNRAHFKAYDTSALVFEVAYTINSADFASYMDIQQAVNLEIFHQFRETGISFAYPTQTIFVNK